jgi:integrase
VVLRDLAARPEAATSRFIIKGRLAAKPLVNLAKPWKGLCRAAELDGVRIHDLRHTAASVGVGHGLSLPIIGRLLGHSQPQTTNRYAHVDGDPGFIGDQYDRRNHRVGAWHPQRHQRRTIAWRRTMSCDR